MTTGSTRPEGAAARAAVVFVDRLNASRRAPRQSALGDDDQLVADRQLAHRRIRLRARRSHRPKWFRLRLDVRPRSRLVIGQRSFRHLQPGNRRQVRPACDDEGVCPGRRWIRLSRQGVQRGQTIRKRAKKPRKMRRDAVSPFRDKIWELFHEQAKGMDGADVSWRSNKRARRLGCGNRRDLQQHEAPGRRAARQCFDITWLTVVCIKLKEIKEGKRPRTRIS